MFSMHVTCDMHVTCIQHNTVTCMFLKHACMKVACNMHITKSILCTLDITCKKFPLGNTCNYVGVVHNIVHV